MTSNSPVPAAQYVRMSKDLQEYSIENQKAAIQRYAAQHGFVIVETYADAGRSGVVLRHREGLRKLLHDVVAEKTRYKAILVYDVSRWGRFQDSDEAAAYEFLCKRAGIPVHYCAEQFSNDGTQPSSIMKALKRTMAAEFSRELSVKVFDGHKRLALLGFRMGAQPGYGLRRLMIGSDRKPKQKLHAGEYKALTTDRVILIPGPKKEVECVRNIYAMALHKKMGFSKIARCLNEAGIPYIGGRQWTNSTVARTLRNPKYAGCNIWNRSTRRLYSPLTPVPPDQWAAKPGAFVPIVDQQTFDRVQIVLQKRAQRTSNEELLNSLKRLLKRRGKLTENLIAEAPNLAGLSTYHSHLGSLRRIYKVVGYRPGPDVFIRSDSRMGTLRLRAELLSQIAVMFGHSVTVFHLPRRMRSIIRFDDSVCVSVIVCPTCRTPKGFLRWKLNPVPGEAKFVTLLCRLNAKNDDFHSFLMLRCMDKLKPCRLNEYGMWFKTGVPLHDLSKLHEVARNLSNS
jgi:DNA invertase Pin-like site-specific DNA recombinase